LKSVLRAISSSLPLRFGSAWARAMEARWHGKLFEDALAFAVPEGCDLDELAIATLSGLLAGYYKRWSGQAEFIKTIHPEIEFRKPLTGSRTFEEAGKIDGLGTQVDDLLVLWEAKSTAESVAPDSEYWNRLRYNTQIFQYVLAARELGWNPEIVIYDVVRKPAIEPKGIPILDEDGCKIVQDAEGNRVFKKDGKPRESGDTAKGYFLQSRLETAEEFGERLVKDTLERPDFYFARREVPILEQDLESFKVHRLIVAKNILHYRSMEKKLSNPADAWIRAVSKWNCQGCAYSGFCLQNIFIDPKQPPAGFHIQLNPELTTAKESA
jgi:hypothetical protein